MPSRWPPEHSKDTVTMSLRDDLNDELKRLRGQGPQVVALSASGGITLTIDFTAIDSLGCTFRELALDVPALQNSAFDALKKWAEQLSQRITYLLEHLAPLEFDPAAGEVMIRSVPPDTLPDGTQYYEVLLQSHSGGRFSLKRFRSEKGTPGRTQVEMHTTLEVLLKLADDLVDTIPSSTP